MSIIKLYHGSSSIIEKPEYGKGNIHNDYGLGFYCTKDVELAREWACTSLQGGYCNSYTLDTSNLRILDLDAVEYGILSWLTLLTCNRTFNISSSILEDNKEYLTDFFMPNIVGYDVIQGYRADDSYFTFAMDFLSNTISLNQLKRSMYLENLGIQIVLVNEKAFDTIEYLESEVIDGKEYFTKELIEIKIYENSTL